MAGVCGVLVVVPLYFLEQRTGEDFPPPITHPEFYYGFLGVTLAWQFMFLVIASDPVRYRTAMLPAMVEKAGFVIAIILLYATDRVAGVWLVFATLDASLLVHFVIAYFQTPSPSAE